METSDYLSKQMSQKSPSISNEVLNELFFKTEVISRPPEVAKVAMNFELLNGTPLLVLMF